MADDDILDLTLSEKKEPVEPNGKRFLNVGGGSKQFKVPSYFDAYEHHLLDINPSLQPDVLMDARTLDNLEADTYDAVFCSHNLEHYYRHEVPMVLSGFSHILKPDGFIEIRVPDIEGVIKHVAKTGMSLTGELYKTASGQIISPLDVFYGETKAIATSCREYMSHRTGFSMDTLKLACAKSGFPYAASSRTNLFELRVLAFSQPPSEDLKAQLGLTAKE